MENRKDHYYKKAKDEGYRARSSYKLKQIQTKFKIIKPGDYVIDLGAAPGGWSQVAGELVKSKGKVIALDKNPMRSFQFDNIITLQMNMESPMLMQHLSTHFNKPINVVLSDLAGNVTGNWHLDSERQIHLATMALRTAETVLNAGGNFVTKVFRGPSLNEFEEELKELFEFKKNWRPPATRKNSAEEYIICKGFVKDE
ncbi:MAG: RlmE family RNA methyltransferase [Candidatus Heimdallarchaeota archaeon]|nr:RlmE family RNA methyltransferase [Candidatus Heimdallarchaeota archaeon]MDH5645032.1 RlmE family RNA methyltransferase [Candidatus Heimdallarchaeota archaeon]